VQHSVNLLAMLLASAILAAPFAWAQSPAKKPAPKPTPAKLGAAPAKTQGPTEPSLAGVAPQRQALALSKEEKDHLALYDAAIAGVQGIKVDEADAQRIRNAVEAISDSDLARGKQLRDQVTTEIGRKLIDWYLYRGGYGTADEIRAFSNAHPNWPDRALLQKRAEEALLNSSASSAAIKAFFADVPPATGAGLGTLAAALAASNETAEAKALAVKAWVEYDIPSAQEAGFIKRTGFLLSEADHRRRLDRLLLTEARTANERNARAVVIRRTIAFLSPPEKKKAEARLAVFLRAKNSSQLMAKLPPEAVAGEWGLAVQKAQLLRRQNKDAAAWKILLSEPEATLKVKPDGWWLERRSLAYAALEAGKPKTAYDLVAEPGQLSVNAHNEAKQMAGWIALRHLKEPKLALKHFQDFVRTADGPLSRARSSYWLGRTYEALGDDKNAKDAYRGAAEHVDTFHGHLARQKLDPRATALKITAPSAPSAAEITRFNSLDTVRAAVLAHKVGLDHSLVRTFLSHARSHVSTEAEFAMLAHLCESLNDTQMAVRIGKAAIARGFNLIFYAYPIHRLPAYTPLRTPAETALVLGIARQESEFGTGAVSSAGAQGILQVMPGTARHICREYKLKCDMKRLLRDNAYNTMMGSAYIADRIDEFSGSYILSLAGYNAGPGRARQWIEEFGDPRHPGVDPVDWIYRIPLAETRGYIQKVLSNVQVYRARLGEGANAVRINADLQRTSER
jgi:soluble lytic murein transglycosylase